METNEHRVFYYHADASPLGGVIHHPSASIIHTQASASLAQAGGRASARIGTFSLDTTVRCEEAYSHVTGAARSDNSGWTTLVTCVVKDLNLLNVVTADRIVAVLAVEYPRNTGYASASIVGSHFVGLRIGGELLDPIIDQRLLYTEGRTYPEQPWLNNPAFLHAAAAGGAILANDVPTWISERYAWVASEEERARKGYVLCSIVKEVQGRSSHPIFGHIVQVPGFGNIFLGELIVDQGAFHLTMLRVELACSQEGDVSVLSAHINGRPIP